MTEPDVQPLGCLMPEMQAETRTIRTENALIRNAVATMVTVADRHEVTRAISDRIAMFETWLELRLDQTERNVEERLTAIEALLKGPRCPTPRDCRRRAGDGCGCRLCTARACGCADRLRPAFTTARKSTILVGAVIGVRT
jgi:hypothetical protein